MLQARSDVPVWQFLVSVCRHIVIQLLIMRRPRLMAQEVPGVKLFLN